MKKEPNPRLRFCHGGKNKTEAERLP